MASVSDTMNLLNEAAGRFPNAVSFLAGRPPDEFADCTPVQSWIQSYLSSRGNIRADRVRLGQYSDTNGIIRDIIASFLAGEGLPHVGASNCMMINGAQEGMLIALLALCRRGRVALAADPTYVGFAGAAEILGVAVESLQEDERFVERLVSRLKRGQGDVGCVYLVPDFANPTGRTLTYDERSAIIDACRRSGATIIEDNAYRRYRYEGEAIPTMYEMAGGDGVVLLESFAKSILPGLRIGVLVTGINPETGKTFADTWSSIKSYVSVATSPLNQAALAGFLQEQEFSLADWMAPRVSRLAASRDMLYEAIQISFEGMSIVQAQKPQGGFFYTIELDREFTLSDCIKCAEEANVLVLPMRLFSLNGQFGNVVRLAFSNVPPDRIEVAVSRLADWLRKRPVLTPFS